ncbi:uncharacterized protein LOC123320130 isoform X1 [Coccinella septempunctata]|uniref:uncharacterized protein LOC123320130 isoform X1 n=1 Tax=Coccinella septempunctata TaxID=41139 RepID=UPI001D09659A|nr:uncharacterized protein LOC123320130 isoform X1 [Coccinella septempunctata]
MYFLVKFDDGVQYICDEKKISNRDGEKCNVKYRNGARYPAKILASNDDLNCLEHLMNKEDTSENEVENLSREEETNSSLLPLTEFNSDDNPAYANANNGRKNPIVLISDEYILLDISTTNAENVSEVKPSHWYPNENTSGQCKSSSSSNESENAGALPTQDSSSGESPHRYPSENTSGQCELPSTTNELENGALNTQDNSSDDDFADTFGDDTHEDSEYLGSLSDSSSSSSEFEKDSSTPKRKENSTNVRTTPNDDTRRSLEISLTANEYGKSSKDDNDMFVRTSEATRNPKNKKLYCMFCGKFQSKFARHIELVHSNETEVKKFINLKKGCTERRNIIETIRKRSQFFYNTNHNVNDGELIVSRRPGKKLNKTASDYIACQNCKGFYTKNNIRHHAKKCFNYDGSRSRTVMVMGRKVLGRIHSDASDILRKAIFPVLREDDVIKSIRYDRLIILYGNKMCCKYRLQHQHDMIRAQLRLLGRFLISLKSINREIVELEDLYVPNHFDDAISAINIVAGLDPNTLMYRAPSTAYTLGSLIKKCGNIHVSECIKKKETEKKQNAEDFLKLLAEDIGVTVNKTVEETQTRNARRKVFEMPSTEDIKTFNTYLRERRQLALNELQTKFSPDSWLALAESTLTSVHVFNRRRAGEIERIFIEDFRSYAQISPYELKSLPSDARKLAKTYVRFVIRGKLNRTVPVLLSRELVKCIESIIEHRDEMGVHRENRYVFGIPGFERSRHKYLRACVLMRKFAEASGACFPSSLRGTKLRKHIATNCINLDLSETEVTDVANFMGHSSKIHKEHYRQPIASREILRISRILELAQGGNDSESDKEDWNDEERGNREVSDELSAVINQPSSTFSSESSGIAESENSCRNAERKRLLSDELSPTQPSTSFSGQTVINDSRNAKKKRSTSPFGLVKKKKRWTEEETRVANMLFEDAIRTEIYPSLKAIQELKQRYPCLKDRNANVIKTWISNKIKIKRARQSN